MSGTSRYRACVEPSSGNLQYVGAVTDIADRKRTERSVAAERELTCRKRRGWPNREFGWGFRAENIYFRRNPITSIAYDRARKPTLEMALPRIHPEDRDQVQGAIDRATRKRSDYERRISRCFYAGRYNQVHPRFGASFKRSARTHRICRRCDRHHRAKQAEDKIRQSEMELRQILDFAPQHVAVLGHDRDRTRLYANQSVLDYFGLTLDEWRTSDRRRYYHPDDWERLTGETQSKFLSGIPHEYEARFQGKDGKYRWFLFRWNPLRDEQGHVIRWYATATDIEDRKQAEQRLQNENVALREEIDKASMFEEIVGTSPTLQAVLSRVSKVAPTDSSCSDHRRNWNGQGTRCPRHSQTFPALLTSVRQCELRSRSARLDCVRIVRS